MSRLKNYVTVALRNLAANKLYSAINIGGLAVGLAACLLILLFVRDELSYERWLPNADRIAAVESTFKPPGRETMAFAGAPGPIKKPLEQDFTSDIERVVRVYGDEMAVEIGDRQFLTPITYADAGFFSVLDLPVVAGDREAALADNKSIALTQTTARRYFGDEPAIGKTITVNKDAFRVVAVLADLPHETHLDLHAVAFFDPARYEKQPWVAQEWTSVNTRAYVLFRSPAAMARVRADMPAFVDRNVNLDIPGFNVRTSSLVEFGFMPLLDIHLHANKPGYTHTGDYAAVVAFAGIAALILIIACINFVNLATARAMKRAREVAMRKVVGATRGQLVGQHLGEAVVTALIALLVAVALVEVSLSPFNAFLHKQLRLDLSGEVLLMVVGLVATVGVVGGLYPALYLSRFRPAEVLKANQSSVTGSSLLRSGLVVFQFAISIALIVCTATIYSQTVYARTFDLGFRHDDRLVIKGLGDLPSKEAQGTLQREVAALPGVRGAALSSDSPPLDSNNNSLLYPTPVPGDDKLLIETVRVDANFFGVYGVTPLAGRLFSADMTSDFQPREEDVVPGSHQSVVVNQAFVAKLGASRPDEVVGKTLYELGSLHGDKPMITTTIVGVVPDLHLRSVRSVITPLMFYTRGPQGGGFSRLTVQVEPGRMRETLAAVEPIWRRLAPTVPIRTGFLDEELAAQYDADAQRGQIFAAFALFAVLIACLGLFGLASFSAQRRTKEIGMRKVLGASVLDIVRLLVWQFSRPVVVANLIAWPVSFYVMSRWLAGFRYAIHLSEPRYLIGIFGGAGLLALTIAWLSIAGHAYKVARANPSRALRCE